jgi:hypothetical protein
VSRELRVVSEKSQPVQNKSAKNIISVEIWKK